MPAARVRYDTFEIGRRDLHIRSLKDTRQYDDADGEAERLGISSASWGLFGVVWNSGRLLAELMTDFDIADRRILEVGCGLGLASLVLKGRGADITATDYHPLAGEFLRRNSALNGCSDVPFERADWADFDDSLGKFDLIIGSDVLYEPDHVDSLSAFVDAHAREHCEVILIDPGREQRGRFRRKMEEYGYEYVHSRQEASASWDSDFHAHVLRYTR